MKKLRKTLMMKCLKLPIRMKVAVFGGSRSGKSSLVRRLVNEKWKEDIPTGYRKTRFHPFIYHYNGFIFHINFWDTSRSSIDFDVCDSLAHQSCDIYLACFPSSLQDRWTFESYTTVDEESKGNARVLFVETMTDCNFIGDFIPQENKKIVRTSMKKAGAQEWLQTSAKTGDGIPALFESICRSKLYKMFYVDRHYVDGGNSIGNSIDSKGKVLKKMKGFFSNIFSMKSKATEEDVQQDIVDFTSSMKTLNKKELDLVKNGDISLFTKSWDLKKKFLSLKWKHSLKKMKQVCVMSETVRIPVILGSGITHTKIFSALPEDVVLYILNEWHIIIFEDFVQNEYAYVTCKLYERKSFYFLSFGYFLHDKSRKIRQLFYCFETVDCNLIKYVPLRKKRFCFEDIESTRKVYHYTDFYGNINSKLTPRKLLRIDGKEFFSISKSANLSKLETLSLIGGKAMYYRHFEIDFSVLAEILNKKTVELKHLTLRGMMSTGKDISLETTNLKSLNLFGVVPFSFSGVPNLEVLIVSLKKKFQQSRMNHILKLQSLRKLSLVNGVDLRSVEKEVPKLFFMENIQEIDLKNAIFDYQCLVGCKGLSAHSKKLISLIITYPVKRKRGFGYGTYDLVLMEEFPAVFLKEVLSMRKLKYSLRSVKGKAITNL